MKKLILIVAICICSIGGVFAGPHHHHHGGYHGGPRGGWGRGYDGVWLAAGITNIVANGLSIANSVAGYPRYVQSTIIAAPQPAPVYYNPPTREVVYQPTSTEVRYVHQPQPRGKVVRVKTYEYINGKVYEKYTDTVVVENNQPVYY